MATGAIRRSTARYGLRASQRVGLHIMMGAGPGSSHGGGHGWMMNPGASHRSTMDAGPTSTTDGAGAPARLGAGHGSSHGGGHGWMMNPGASHRSTMDA